MRTGEAEKTPCITDSCVIKASTRSPRVTNRLSSERAVGSPIGRKRKARNRMENITLQQAEEGIQISNLSLFDQ
jgi:hypothetical protein